MSMRFTHRCAGNAAVLEMATADTGSMPHSTPYASYLGERNQHASLQVREAISDQALAILGAHDLRYPNDAEVPYLAFRVRGSVKCDHLRVEMLDDDQYTVTASRSHTPLVGPAFLRPVDTREGVTRQDLVRVLERMTDIILPGA